MNYVVAKDKQFYYNDQPLTLRGFGIGNWLCIEHFMAGIPGSETIIREGLAQAFDEQVAADFVQTYQESYVQEADFQLLKECGVNFIRVPFNYRLFLDSQTNEWREEGFRYFDHLFALCNKYEIFAMPDLHAVPGSQNPDWHSDNSLGVPLFWQYQCFREQMTEMWHRIAKRYQHEPYLMGYDLLNEPAMASWEHLNQFYTDTIQAIREVDSHHLIVLEGDLFSMDFSGLAQFTDSQLALGFHYYPTVWQPDLLELPRNQRIEKIAQGLDKLIAYGDEFDLPVVCGEFGYAGLDLGGDEIANELLVDTLQLFEKRGLSWTLWCYKDAHYMSLVSPAISGSWMMLAKEIRKHWTQDIEKEQASALLAVLKGFFPEMSSEEEYLMQFRLRADMYSLEKNHITIPLLHQYTTEKLLELPKDFAFPECVVNQAMKQIVTPFLK